MIIGRGGDGGLVSAGEHHCRGTRFMTADNRSGNKGGEPKFCRMYLSLSRLIIQQRMKDVVVRTACRGNPEVWREQA